MVVLHIAQFQKISILPPPEGIEIPWKVGGSMRPKRLMICMKLNWNFLRGGEELEKKPFCGGGMDIFWNNT